MAGTTPQVTVPKVADLSVHEMRDLVKEKGIEIAGFSKMSVDRKRQALEKALAAKKSRSSKKKGTRRRKPATFAQVVKEVESILTEVDAIEKLQGLRDAEDLNQFRLGGVLVRMQEQGWYGDGSSDFYEYVQEAAGIGKRDAQYRMKVYRDLCELDVSWDQVDGIGWTKLRLVSPILNDENVDEVFDAIESMSTRDVEFYVKEYSPDGTAESAERSATPTVVRSVRFPKDDVETYDRAIKRAKEEADTQYESVALVYIAMDYLAGGEKPVASIDEVLGNLKASSNSENTAFKKAWAALAKTFPEHVDPDID